MTALAPLSPALAKGSVGQLMIGVAADVPLAADEGRPVSDTPVDADEAVPVAVQMALDVTAADAADVLDAVDVHVNVDSAAVGWPAAALGVNRLRASSAMAASNVQPVPCAAMASCTARDRRPTDAVPTQILNFNVLPLRPVDLIIILPTESGRDFLAFYSLQPPPFLDRIRFRRGRPLLFLWPTAAGFNGQLAEWRLLLLLLITVSKDKWEHIQTSKRNIIIWKKPST